MAKYDPLSRYLKNQTTALLVLTFTEIEMIIGAKLPPSARTHKEWWWSDTHADSTHVQCRAWVRNGYFTEMVNLDAEQVTFRKGQRVRKSRRVVERSQMSRK